MSLDSLWEEIEVEYEPLKDDLSRREMARLCGWYRDQQAYLVATLIYVHGRAPYLRAGSAPDPSLLPDPPWEKR